MYNVTFVTCEWVYIERNPKLYRERWICDMKNMECLCLSGSVKDVGGGENVAFWLDIGFLDKWLCLLSCCFDVYINEIVILAFQFHIDFISITCCDGFSPTGFMNLSLKVYTHPVSHVIILTEYIHLKVPTTGGNKFKIGVMQDNYTSI